MPDLMIVCARLPFTARPGQPDVTGQYLKAYDPEAHGGLGHAEWTTDPAEAMTFPGVAEAQDCWTQVPKARPRRGDGRPNRPLTAFSITLTPAPEPS